MSDAQQQRQQQPAAIDYAPVYATLTPENKAFFDKNGYDKAGEGGKPGDINVILNGYRNQEKLLGSARLEEPRLDDDKLFSEWKGHALLGAKGKPEDYKLTERPALPEGMKWSEAAGDGGVVWDKDMETVLRTGLTKAHIGEKQANVLFKELAAAQMGRVVQQMQTQQQSATAAEADLRKDWGGAYEQNRGTAKLAAEYLGQQVKMDAGAIADVVAKVAGDTQALKLFHTIGRMLGEDKLGTGASLGFVNGSPEAAKAELGRLKTDTGHQAALDDKRHPGHKAAEERENRLFQQAYGN